MDIVVLLFERQYAHLEESLQRPDAGYIKVRVKRRKHKLQGCRTDRFLLIETEGLVSDDNVTDSVADESVGFMLNCLWHFESLQHLARSFRPLPMRRTRIVQRRKRTHLGGYHFALFSFHPNLQVSLVDMPIRDLDSRPAFTGDICPRGIGAAVVLARQDLIETAGAKERFTVHARDGLLAVISDENEGGQHGKDGQPGDLVDKDNGPEERREETVLPPAGMLLHCDTLSPPPPAKNLS